MCDERRSDQESSEETKPSDPLVTQKNAKSTKKDLDEADKTDSYIIPDGGWGWLVTFCVFIIYVILDGSVFSFGVIYVELLNYFNETGGKTAVVGALLYGFPLLLAPFVCAFVIHGGFRLVGVIGAVLVTISFVLCSFAQSIDYLTVVLGILGSAGMEMGYVSAIICITYYFDKNRGLATGLAMSGSGVGTFIFPPMLEMLLKDYSWRGTCLIIGGICLNLIPCSLVFRPLKKKQTETSETDENMVRFDKILSSGLNGANVKYLSGRRMSKSTTDLPTFSKTAPKSSDKLHASDPNVSRSHPRQHHFKHPGKFSNSFHHGGYALAFSITSLDDHDTVDGYEVTCRNRITHAFKTFSTQTLKILRSSVDWSLLKDTGFMLFGFSNFLLCVYFGLPYLYIPHYAQINGIDEQKASFLVSIMGITSTASQIVIGWIGDKTKASVHIYIACMLLGGGSLITMPFFPDNYSVFCFLCVVFGIGISGNYALTTLILIDLLGLEKLTVSFGMFQLQQGVASLFGTPIGGWIFDATGSYFWAFMSGGICVMMSGLVLLPVPFLVKCKQNAANVEESASLNGTSAIEMIETRKIEV